MRPRSAPVLHHRAAMKTVTWGGLSGRLTLEFTEVDQSMVSDDPVREQYDYLAVQLTFEQTQNPGNLINESN